MSNKPVQENGRPKTDATSSGAPAGRGAGKKERQNTQRNNRGRFNDRKNGGQSKQSRGDRGRDDKQNKRPNRRNHRNQQRKGDQLNISNKNLSPAQTEKIKIVKNSVGSGFSSEEIYLTLHGNDFDTRRAIQALTAKPSPWSTIVTRGSGAQPQKRQQRRANNNGQPAANGNYRQTNGKGNKNNGQNGTRKSQPKAAAPKVVTPPPEENIDPEVMQAAIDKQLLVVQERSNLLLNFKKELSNIHSMTNGQLDKLGNERQLLLEQQTQLKEQLVLVEKRLREIDTSMTALEQDKVDKLVKLRQEAKLQQIEILDGV